MGDANILEETKIQRAMRNLRFWVVVGLLLVLIASGTQCRYDVLSAIRAGFDRLIAVTDSRVEASTDVPLVDERGRAYTITLRCNVSAGTTATESVERLRHARDEVIRLLEGERK